MTNKKIELAKKSKETKNKLMLVSGPFNAKQLLMILQKTPKEHIYRRPAKGGGEWEYVTGVYVKKALNYIFGWMWDFQVLEHGREKSYISDAVSDGELVWVLGRLSIRDKKGNLMILKEQFGRAEIKYKKGTKIPLDFGNDLKAASTDALKKCASELGIASDIYGKEEFKDIMARGGQVKQPIDSEKKKEKFVPPQFECFECAGPMTKAEVEYSKKVFKKQLCRTCQKEHRR